MPFFCDPKTGIYLKSKAPVLNDTVLLKKLRREIRDDIVFPPELKG